MLKLKLLKFFLQLGFSQLQKVRILRYFIQLIFVFEIICYKKELFFDVDVYYGFLEINVKGFRWDIYFCVVGFLDRSDVSVWRLNIRIFMSKVIFEEIVFVIICQYYFI